MKLGTVAGGWWHLPCDCRAVSQLSDPYGAIVHPVPCSGGWGPGWDEPGGTQWEPFSHVLMLCCRSICPAVCEGNFTCKENEVCVRPSECRCRHGYFGANCDTSEYRWHRGAPQGGPPHALP